MIYDKKTGDVIIIDKNANQPKKKIINNFDDLEKERQQLMKEVDDRKDLSEDQRISEKYNVVERFKKLYDVDPTQF
jgi:hypothetical protein